jgi:hypothetical protein
VALFAVAFFAVAFFAVAFFAVALFAVALFAVALFAVALFAGMVFSPLARNSTGPADYILQARFGQGQFKDARWSLPRGADGRSQSGRAGLSRALPSVSTIPDSPSKGQPYRERPRVVRALRREDASEWSW